MENNYKANSLWESAERFYKKTGDIEGLANCQMNYGELEFQLKNKEKAKTHWQSALEIYEKFGHAFGIKNAQKALQKL